MSLYLDYIPRFRVTYYSEFLPKKARGFCLTIQAVRLGFFMLKCPVRCINI